MGYFSNHKKSVFLKTKTGVKDSKSSTFSSSLHFLIHDQPLQPLQRAGAFERDGSLIVITQREK